MSGRQATQASMRRALPVIDGPGEQNLGHKQVVNLGQGWVQGQQGLAARGKSKSTGIGMVVQGGIAEAVASQEEAPGGGVPDGERPITQQALDTALAPTQVSALDQVAVGQSGLLGCRHVQSPAQIGAIVEAGGGRQPGAAG